MITAVVEMLVFQAQKVPHKSPEDLQRRGNKAQNVGADSGRLSQGDRRDPDEPQ